MNNNNYNIDKKLREMENQMAPDLAQMDNHWQHMKSILANPSLSKSPGKGFLKNPFRLFILLCATGLTCLILFKYAFTTKIQSNSNNSSPAPNSIATIQTDTVPKAKKKLLAYERKDSTTRAVPQKKMATQKKMYEIKNGKDSVGSVSYSTPENDGNDTIHFYLGNKKVATHVLKKLPTAKDTIHFMPMKKKYPTTDTIRFNLDSVNTNTNVRYSRKVKEPVNKNNNTSIDSTKY